MIEADISDLFFTSTTADLMPIEITIASHKLTMSKFILDQFFKIPESNTMADKYVFELGLSCHKKDDTNINDLVIIIGRIMIGYSICWDLDIMINSHEHIELQDYVALYKFVDQYFMPTDILIIEYISDVKKCIIKNMDVVTKAFDLVTNGPGDDNSYVDAAAWLIDKIKLDGVYIIHPESCDSIERKNESVFRQYYDVDTHKIYFCYQKGYSTTLQPVIDNLYNLVRTYAEAFNIFKLDWITDDSIIYLEAMGLDAELIKKMI